MAVAEAFDSPLSAYPFNLRKRHVDMKCASRNNVKRRSESFTK